MCFIKIRKGDSDAKVNSKERINTMENYRTPHYQSPETIARQHYTDTWVEQILSYPIDGIDVKSLA